jgi:hypothetical protein
MTHQSPSMYNDLTLIVGLSKHLYDFQIEQTTGTCTDNALILANALYASGITNISIRVGTIVGLMGSPPFPAMRPHTWVEREGDVIDCSCPTHEMSDITYFESYSDALKYYTHIITAIIGRIDLSGPRRNHLSSLLKMKDVLKQQNYMLVENEYVRSYQEYCERDPRMQLIVSDPPKGEQLLT